ncbi:hypothetical protein AMTRI_Chr01g105080 [Amborella trichopoda]
MCGHGHICRFHGSLWPAPIEINIDLLGMMYMLLVNNSLFCHSLRLCLLRFVLKCIGVCSCIWCLAYHYYELGLVVPLLKGKVHYHELGNEKPWSIGGLYNERGGNEDGTATGIIFHFGGPAFDSHPLRMLVMTNTNGIWEP